MDSTPIQKDEDIKQSSSSIAINNVDASTNAGSENFRSTMVQERYGAKLKQFGTMLAAQPLGASSGEKFQMMSTKSTNTVSPSINNADTNKSIKDMYKIGKTIGKGTFSHVKMGQNRATNEAVAVKIIKKEGLTAKQLGHVVLECETLRQLSHPNIISYKDYFEEEKFICIVTDLMEMSLTDYINKFGKQLTEDEIKKIFKMILVAVQHCHKESIIHRDLKPDNILVNLDPNQKVKELKLGDLGLSCQSNKIDFNDLVGTRGYMAPEMYKPGCQYASKIDCWSLGCILYNLVTLKHPFEGETKEEIKDKVLNSFAIFDMRVWSKYSFDVYSLTQCLLEKNQEVRYSLQETLACKWLRDKNENVDQKDG